MSTGHYRFHVGDYECVSLYDGFHDYDLERMVCNKPRSEVASALQLHGFSPDVIRTPFTFLYVNTGNHRILVDTGAGDLLPTTGKLLENMHQAGIAPESIDSVFITHAHGDHVNGLLDPNGQPNFSGATYFLCQAEWDFWFSEQAPEQASQHITDIARYNLSAIKDKTILLEREEEILLGVRVLLAPGHTPGHMAVAFASGNERLLYVGDTVLHPLHLEYPDWEPIYDVLPDLAASSKQRIFDLAASDNYWVMAQQFPPFPSVGHVVKTDNGWKWQPTGNDRHS